MIQAFFNLALVRWKSFLFTIILTIGLMLIYLIPTQIISNFFENLQNKTINVNSLVQIIIIILFAASANMIIMMQSGVFALDTTFWSADFFRKKILYAFINSTHKKEFFDNAEIHSKITDDVDVVADSMNWIFDVSAQVVVALVTIGILISISWQLTLFCLVPLMLLQLLLKITHKKLEGLAESSRVSAANVTSGIKNIFGSATTIFAFEKQLFTIKYLENLNQIRMEASLRFRFFDEILNSFSTSIFYLGTAFSLIGTALFYRSLSLDIRDIIMFIFFLPFASGIITLIGDIAPQISSFAVSVKRIREIKIDFLDKNLVDCDNSELSLFSRFETLSLHQNLMPEVLSDVSLAISIKAGQKIVVFGGVGSGKSTFLQAISGNQSQNLFEMTWNDVIVRFSSKAFVYPRVTYTAQVPILFEDTVRNNMRLHLDTLANDLKNSMVLTELQNDQLDLESSVGVMGSQLSGGQRQRLALARALSFGGDILVLDDPFSSLDQNTVSKIWKNLQDMDKQTIVIATNREFILRESDLVIYLVNNRVISVATFEYIEKQHPEIKEIMI